MWLLIDDNLWLDSIWVGQATSLFKKVGMDLKVLKIKVGSGNTGLKKLKELPIEGKRLIITNGKINYQRRGAILFEYEGLCEKVSGEIGVVSTKSLNKKTMFIALHEALHLVGLKHCQSNGCLMALKLCAGELKYCLSCNNVCKEIMVCGECYGRIRKDNS